MGISEFELGVVKDWKDLEIGKFYQLDCKCEGMVISKHEKPTRHGFDTGFYFAYSVGGCAGRLNHKESYRMGFGPYTNFFNYDLCESAMPAIEIAKPDWWDEVSKKNSPIWNSIRNLK